MKLPSRFALAVFVFAGLCASSPAQDAPVTKDEIVDIKDIKVAVQKTPDIAMKGTTTDKRWKPKDWLEIEPEFRMPRSATDKKAEVVPEVTFKYYVYLNSATGVKENARILTAEVVHTNVPLEEWSHSVVYISPSTILRVTGKPEGNASLVAAYAVEISKAGKVVGFFSKLGGSSMTSPTAPNAKWWELPKAPPQEPGLLSKNQTPFAPLWGDFHADVKPK